jgi:hypothetical protein
MKWYFGLNETGVHNGTGLHAKLAVLSARRVGGLEPVMLYTGQADDFTGWMRGQGVEVLHITLPFAELVHAKGEAGGFLHGFDGHWLRSQICRVEQDAAFVLYTDCDVVFLRALELGEMQPALFAAAPEFRPNNWNYFNSGVLVMNVAALRAGYDAFERFIEAGLEEDPTFVSNDQYAYNAFYRGRWERLHPLFNWKPYWGVNTGARVLHFHGPKLPHMRAILDGAWDWSSDFGRQVGSLFVAHLPAYAHYLRAAAGELPERDEILAIADVIGAYATRAPYERVDLGFLDWRMFPE